MPLSKSNLVPKPGENGLYLLRFWVRGPQYSFFLGHTNLK